MSRHISRFQCFLCAVLLSIAIAAAGPAIAQSGTAALSAPSTAGFGLPASAAPPQFTPAPAAAVHHVRLSASARHTPMMRLAQSDSAAPASLSNAAEDAQASRAGGEARANLYRTHRKSIATDRADSEDRASAQTDETSADSSAQLTLTQLHLQHLAHKRALLARHLAALAHRAAVKREESEPLDAMTKDGVAAPTAVKTDQGMSVGAAIVRTLIALAAVLALAYGAILYLKRKGYGAANAGDSAPPADRPTFGVSPLAQMLLNSGRAAAGAAEPKPETSAGAPSGIDGLEVLARAPLPGTQYTLHKVRVGDRVLLLAGAPGSPLTVLTEWDVEAQSEDGPRFNEMLDRMSAPPAKPRVMLVQGGPKRLEPAGLAASAAAAPAMASSEAFPRGPWQT